MRFEWCALLLMAAPPAWADDDGALPPAPPPPPGAASQLKTHDGAAEPEPEPASAWGPRHTRDPRYAFDPPVREPGDFTHDGLLLRLAAGPAYVIGEVSGQVSGASVPSYTSSFEAVALRLDVTLAGPVFDGFSIGARLGMLILPDPQLDMRSPLDGSVVDASPVIVPAMGVLADWYPVPDMGLHLFAGPSFTVFNLADGGDFATTEIIGIMASAGVGYEAWLSEQWSFGALVGADVAVYGGDSYDEAHFVVPGLELCFTYH